MNLIERKKSTQNKCDKIMARFTLIMLQYINIDHESKMSDVYHTGTFNHFHSTKYLLPDV